MKHILLLFSIALLVGCATPAITLPDGPGGVIAAVDPTGCTFNDEGHALWLSEGVPASYFVEVPQGWHITNLLYHQGNSIRVLRVNPKAPVAPIATK